MALFKTDIELVMPTSVDDLLAFMSPDSARWNVLGSYSEKSITHQSAWLFRGQRGASRPLIPAALRLGELDPYAPLMRPPTTFHPKASTAERAGITYSHILEMELNAVRKFIELADRFGLAPHWGGSIQHELDAYATTLFPTLLHVLHGDSSVLQGVELPATLHEVFALAQHHGIPTRLLDWTESWEVALFFAVYKFVFSAKRAGSDQHEDFAVWAVRRPNLSSFVPSRMNNPFLRHQKGVLSLPPPAEEYLRSGEWRCCSHQFGTTPDGPAAYKIVGPAEWAPELLHRLHRRGVQLLSLMPSLDNVRTALLHDTLLFHDVER